MTASIRASTFGWRFAAKMSEKGILDYLAFWPRHDDVYQRFRPAMSLMRGRFAFE